MLDSLLKLLAGELPKEIVWTADITYWLAGRRQTGAAKREWDTEQGYLQLHKDLGILPYYYYEKFWAGQPHYASGVEIVAETRGNVSTRRFRTPVGELFEEQTYLPESACVGCTKHLVECSADLDVLLYILERRRLEPANLADYPERREIWRKYDGLPCLGLPRSPLAALCCEWAGVENTVYLLMDAEDKIVQALELMEAQETPVLDAVCELAPPLVHFPDNLASDNLTSLYDDYLAPGHARRLARLHAAGVKCAVHLDGMVRGLLPKLAKIGFDAIESLTPKPGGDVDVGEMRKLAGNDTVILWGGIPGILFAPPYSWEEMQAHLEQVLECWPGQPFILGVADQVPPDGDLEFCRKIAEFVRQSR